MKEYKVYCCEICGYRGSDWRDAGLIQDCKKEYYFGLHNGEEYT